MPNNKFVWSRLQAREIMKRLMKMKRKTLLMKKKKRMTRILMMTMTFVLPLTRRKLKKPKRTSRP